jgi:hypothetical protein
VDRRRELQVRDLSQEWVETSAVTVTPVLYLSNGAKYKLPDVNLEPSGTAVVDINAGLEKLGIASYATLSGYVEIDYSWPWDPICATIRNLDTAHSLIYHYTLRSTKPIQLPDQPAPTLGKKTNVIDGMWWKQESEVTGFVSLANTAAEPISANVDVSNDQGAAFARHPVTISPHGMKTIQLKELLVAPASSGGIRVTYIGNTNDLIINGGLEDQNAGYSAVLPFGPAPAASKISHATIAEIGLMAGAADPMMQFPAGTTFTPYTVLRNVSTSPVTATPTVWWMAAGAAQSARLSPLTLGPLQSRALDIPTMMAAAGLKSFNGNLNIVVDREGQTGALLMAGGSVDQTNTYVFEVIPHSVKESASKSLSYWSTGNGDDTMVTLWNPADEAQDFIFKFTFTGGHYLYPIRLDPRATRTFNISDIIENQVPDAEGNTIPGSVHEGAAKLMGSQADNQNILVSMSAGIYNVRKATCNIVCHGCDGATSWNMVDSPSATAVAGTKQQRLEATWNTGNTYDESNWASWSTGNSAVATVETSVKGQTAGLVHGIAAGSTGIGASDNYLNSPDYTSNWCEQADWSCPLNFGGTASAPVTVPTVTFSNIPSVQIGQIATTTATVSPSTNTFPIALSITPEAAIVSPTGTFTQTTVVTVKGMSAGTATITAKVSNSDGSNPTVGSTSFPVIPSISGPNTVWWFNGLNPASSAYPTSVTLTSSGGSSTSWSVSQSDAKVNLSSTTGAQITVTSTGSHFSGQNGDISIIATAGGLQSAPFTMTAKTPWKLVFIKPQTFCNSSPLSYSTELTYNLIDNLDVTMSTDISWNESVGTAVCVGSNWCKNGIGTSGGFTNPVTDTLEPPELNSSPAPTPKPVCNGQGTGQTRYRSIPQTIKVGNSSTGGVQVQSDALGYYVDHGQHDSIQSPSKPPQ